MTSGPHSALSRRRFLQDATLMSLTLSMASLQMPALAFAQPATPLKRSNVLSADGKIMLARYAEGVKKMKALPAHDPRSWIFQANIHDYPDDEKINEIFNPALGKTPQEKAAIAARKAMALGIPGKQPRVWKTCSHFLGYGDHFLTWHRIYLHYFEATIATLIAKPFALPYWAYEKNAFGKRALPKEFMLPASKDNPLWHPNRKIRSEKIVKSNDPTKNDEGIKNDDEVSLAEALACQTLLDIQPADDDPEGAPIPGFSGMIEGIPHGAIHVAVGYQDAMGATAKAARDPIFWLHHANIDRVWESWRRVSKPSTMPGTFERDPINDTAWKKWAAFPFADQTRARKEMTVLDCLNAKSKFGLDYDKYEPVASDVVAFGFGADGQVKMAASTTLSKGDKNDEATITKQGEPVTVTLKPAVEPAVVFGFGERTETVYTLVVDVEAKGQTSAAYEAYLVVPETPGSQKMVEKRVATFNLFGAGHGAHQDGHEGHGTAIKAKWQADVTKLVKDKLLDPSKPGDLIFRALYNDPEAPVIIKSRRIDAR